MALRQFDPVPSGSISSKLTGCPKLLARNCLFESIQFGLHYHICSLYRVIDGENITISDEHMWLIPYTEGSNHTLTITFPQHQQLVGLRFWNYNKSAEDTYRGVSFYLQHESNSNLLTLCNYLIGGPIFRIPLFICNTCAPREESLGIE